MLTVFIALALSDGTSAYSLALQQDGSVWATGSNSNGQFGNGLKTSSKTFVQVVPRGGIAIAAGAFHSLVLNTDGTVWCSSEFKQPGCRSRGTGFSKAWKFEQVFDPRTQP